MNLLGLLLVGGIVAGLVTLAVGCERTVRDPALYSAWPGPRTGAVRRR